MDKVSSNKLSFFFCNFFAFICLLIFCSCASRKHQKLGNENSNPKALEQNDWFRGKGTDRFYLASLYSEEKLKKGTAVFKGNELTFGVGCYSEPSDREAEVLVRRLPNDKTPSLKKRLYERRFLHEFQLVAHNVEPQPGQCKVLLGDPFQRMVISNTSYNFGSGDKSKVVMQGTFTTTSCVGAIFSWGTFIGGLSTGGGGLGMPMLSWWAGSGTWFCGLNMWFLYRDIENFKAQENRKLLYNAFMEAAILTDAKLFGVDVEKVRARQQGNRSDALLGADASATFGNNCEKSAHWNCQSYLNAIRAKNYALSAGIYNLLFVQTFNQRIWADFEQGWKIDRKNTRFFDAVASFQTELANAQEKNFSSVPGLRSSNILTRDENVELIDVLGSEVDTPQDNILPDGNRQG